MTASDREETTDAAPAEAPSADAEAPSAAASEDTSELDALLASLSDDVPPAEAPAAAGEEPMDPELEALLKSLA